MYTFYTGRNSYAPIDPCSGATNSVPTNIVDQNAPRCAESYTVIVGIQK
jgi:hypothetical protein